MIMINTINSINPIDHAQKSASAFEGSQDIDAHGRCYWRGPVMIRILRQSVQSEHLQEGLDDRTPN